MSPGWYGPKTEKWKELIQVKHVLDQELTNSWLNSTLNQLLLLICPTGKLSPIRSFDPSISKNGLK
jgi:hypothetical protein